MAAPEQKNIGMLLVVLAIVAVLGVVLVSTFKAAQPITVNAGDQSPDRNILTVTGTHEMEVAPDQAELTLAVVTNASKASDASDQNRDLMNKVVSALKAQGIAASDIETTNVYLAKQNQWDYTLQRTVDQGYQQTTTIKVTTKKLDTVGNVLDAAVQAGANNVQDISFTLTPESEATYKDQALAAATKVAKGKAQTLADASGATLGRITSLSESSSGVQPYYYAMSAGISMDKVAAAPTPISPQKVSISVSVTIGYELN